VYCCAWRHWGYVVLPYCCATQYLSRNLATRGAKRGEGRGGKTRQRSATCYAIAFLEVSEFYHFPHGAITPQYNIKGITAGCIFPDYKGNENVTESNIICCCISVGSRDSSVSTATRLRSERPRNRGSTPGMATRFLTFCNIQTGSGTHPAFYKTGTRGKAAKAWSWPSPPPNAEVMEGGAISPLPHSLHGIVLN
jgi:hypothetical protein